MIVLTKRVSRKSTLPCMAKLRGGRICGDIWREHLCKGTIIVSTRCYSHGHLQDHRGRVITGQLDLF